MSPNLRQIAKEEFDRAIEAAMAEGARREESRLKLIDEKAKALGTAIGLIFIMVLALLFLALLFGVVRWVWR